MTGSPASPTPCEQIAVCISREIADGDVVGLGLGTILPMAGALLAQRLHAPASVLFYAPVGAYVRQMPRLTVSLGESLAEPYVVARPHLPQLFTQELHPGHLEFFRPAQIDAAGNINATVIGSLDRPAIRLPGGAGIPDITAILDRIFYYLPRHDRRCFVPAVDFITGAGHRGPNRGSGPYKVFTDLGVFGFDDGGRMCALSVHDGVEASVVTERTGFALAGLEPGLPVTDPPTAEELQTLRDSVDPFGVVELEGLPSRERRKRLLEIYEQEIADG